MKFLVKILPIFIVLISCNYNSSNSANLEPIYLRLPKDIYDSPLVVNKNIINRYSILKYFYENHEELTEEVEELTNEYDLYDDQIKNNLYKYYGIVPKVQEKLPDSLILKTFYKYFPDLHILEELPQDVVELKIPNDRDKNYYLEMLKKLFDDYAKIEDDIKSGFFENMNNENLSNYDSIIYVFNKIFKNITNILINLPNITKLQRKDLIRFKSKNENLPNILSLKYKNTLNIMYGIISGILNRAR